ncbi:MULTISPECIES: MalY/PatB family protein [Acetobacter]|nr:MULTISPECIES: PatB family C-S lyase [Acetobacter]KXV11069.1 aminotransferase [Acetobacter malorum]
MKFDFDTPLNRRGTDSNKWTRYPAEVLPLWVADMDFPVAPAITDALRQRLTHPIFGYAAAQDSLRQTIVATMKARYDWTITPADIVMLPGVEPGFNMALKAFLAPGEHVAIQTPAYPPILRSPTYWNLLRRDIWLTPGEDGSWPMDDATWSAQLSGCKALLLCNPHNPTGKIYSRAELERIAHICQREDALIISDEIHCGLVYDGRKHVPIASLSPKTGQRCITLMAASKSYNIAGLKTAFAIITNPELRVRFENSRMGMVDSVNIFGLIATEAAYAHGEEWLTDLKSYLQKNRDLLISRLRQDVPEIIVHTPQSTFLAWLDCSRLGLPSLPYDYFLSTANIALSNGADFHETATKNFVRLNFGCSRSTLLQALDHLVSSVHARS